MSWTLDSGPWKNATAFPPGVNLEEWKSPVTEVRLGEMAEPSSSRYAEVYSVFSVSTIASLSCLLSTLRLLPYRGLSYRDELTWPLCSDLGNNTASLVNCM